ncbi:unnamed protein product [Gadus morhua 'NCC']
MASLTLHPLTLSTSSPTHSQPTPPKRHSQPPPTTVSPPSRTSTRECEWRLQVGCPIPVPANGITPPSHLRHPRRPDQGSAFRYQGLRPAPLRLEGAPGCIRFLRLLKEDGRDFMGVGEVAYDVQFGGGCAKSGNFEDPCPEKSPPTSVCRRDNLRFGGLELRLGAEIVAVAVHDFPKLPLAQNQTDLASEAEDPTTDRRPKRKIKPSRHVRLDFENQDPSPPKKQAFQILPKAPAISGPSNIRRFITAQPTQSGCYEVPVINEDPQDFQLQHLMTLGSTLRQAIGTSYGGGDMAESGSEVEMVGTSDQGQSVSPGTGTQQGNYAIRGCDQMCGTLLRDLLVNQQILMDQQKTMIRMIQDLHRPIQGGQRMSTTSRHTAYFPLGDKLALEALEDDLASQRDLHQELIITLGLAGGADAKDTVWRILKQAIKNDLAKNISWRGMNGKISFEKLLLKAVVKDAVRCNPSCSTATDVQIADAIKRWFYWAGDREGGRKKRQPAPNQEQTD